MSRYIDADKHLQKLRERRDTAIMWELNCNDEATKDRAKEAILIFNECISELIDAPTADVRENVKGEWIRHTEQKNIYGGKCVECSECGEKYMVQYIEDEKFCRNCGADMRGGDAE